MTKERLVARPKGPASAELLDSARAAGALLEDVVAVFASLLVIRLIDEQDEEKRAIAEFDGAPFESSLPKGVSWESLVSQPTNRRAIYFFDQLIPAIKNSIRKQGTPLQFVEDALASISGRPNEPWISAIVDRISSFDLTDKNARQEIGQSFEALVGEGSRHLPYAGEYTTPKFVVELMVKIASPQPGDRIYDPCFGSGGLLTKAATQIIRKSAANHATEWNKIRDESIFGIERNSRLCLIAAARLMLAGIGQPRLECGDALDRGAYQYRSATGFDCIFANPPFGQRVERTLSSQYRIASNTGHNLFLQHILGSLRPGGRAVVLVPETLLFASGADEHLRKLMLSEYRVDEVISLPAGALGPQTSVKCNVLVVRRLPPRRTVWLPGNAYDEYLTSKTWKSRVGQMFVLAAKARTGSADRKSVQRELAWIQAGPHVEETRRSEELIQALTVTAKFFSREPENDGSANEAEGDLPTSVVPVSLLADNEWQLVAKRFEPSSLDDFVGRLASAFPTAQVIPLADCADVFLGMRYRTSAQSLKERRVSVEQLMKLVRVQDVSAADAVTDELPTLRSDNSAIIKAEVGIPSANARLSEGDILLSVGGTIGRVAIVGATEEDAVASSGLAVVRCGERLTNDYLGGLLRTRPYQDWLSAQATGTSIRHLSVRTLRRLKIPLLTLEDQRRLTPKLKPGADERAILSTRPEPEGVDWLETLVRDKNARQLAILAEGNADRMTLAAVLRRTLVQMRRWRNSLAHDAASNDAAREVFSWFASAEDLDNALSLQRATERWGALQSWLHRYKRWEDHAATVLPHLVAGAAWGSGKSHVLHVWRQLEKSLPGIVNAELRDLSSTTKLIPSANPALLTVGKETEVTISVRNEGPLPLQKLSIGTQPFFSSSSCATLSPQETHQWTIRVLPRDVGKIDVDLRWWALNLDGESVNGTLNLGLEVQTLRESAQPIALGESPYIVGNPIDESKPEMFFGRDAVVTEIAHSLRSDGPSSVLLLEGNRRVGKSSILLHLKSDVLPALWLPVYCNFQKFEGHPEKAGVPTADVFYGIAKEMAVAAAMTNSDLEIPGAGIVPAKQGVLATAGFFIQKVRPLFRSEHPFEQFQLMIEAILAGSSSHRFLLMLDEFDKIQEGIENGITSPQLPENLRNMFHSYNRISGILCGSRNIRKLRSEYWNALFGLGKSIVIKALDHEAARNLVTAPVKGRLVYAPLAVDLIVSECAYQPFLIQGLCDVVFQYCAKNKTNSVTVEAVEEAAIRFAKDNGHFRHVWDHIRTDRQRFLVCLVDELAEAGTPITTELLRLTLQQKGVEYEESDKLEEDLDELVEAEILRENVNQRLQTYRIEIPIFSDWLQSNENAAKYEIAARNQPS